MHPDHKASFKLLADHGLHLLAQERKRTNVPADQVERAPARHAPLDTGGKIEMLLSCDNRPIGVPTRQTANRLEVIRPPVRPRGALVIQSTGAEIDHDSRVAVRPTFMVFEQAEHRGERGEESRFVRRSLEDKAFPRRAAAGAQRKNRPCLRGIRGNLPILPAQEPVRPGHELPCRRNHCRTAR